ncbi:unnamed protein product [Camellia sinensis]
MKPSDHDRRPRVGPTIHKPQTPHIRILLLNPHHRIRTKDPPEHIIALHHQINGRHSRSHTRTQHIRCSVTHTEWLHRFRYREVEPSGFLHKRLIKSLVNRRLENRVRSDGADLGPTKTILINGQQCLIDLNLLSVDFYSVDSNKILIRRVYVGYYGVPYQVQNERSINKKPRKVNFGKKMVGPTGVKKRDSRSRARAGEAERKQEWRREGGANLRRERDVGAVLEQEKTKSGIRASRPGSVVVGKASESTSASAMMDWRVTEFSGNMAHELLAQPGEGGWKQLEQAREWRESQRGVEQGMEW